MMRSGRATGSVSTNARVSDSDRASASKGPQSASQSDSESAIDRDPLEQRGHPIDGRVPGRQAIANPACPLGKSRSQVWLPQDAAERLRQRVEVARLNDDLLTVAHELLNRAGARADDRQSS